MTATTAPTLAEMNLQLIAAGVHPDELTAGIDRDVAIKTIRTALKKRSGKTWSVTGGSGTAWGWITIQAPPARRVAHVANPDWHYNTPDENLPAFFEAPASAEHGAWYTSEAECTELATLLGMDRPVHCQGVSIAAGSDYRREYMARALGLEPLSFGVPYWD